MRLSIKTKLIIIYILIVTAALLVISERGLKFVSMDKETYVQDLNSQNVLTLSNFLFERITTLEKIMSTFTQSASYRFASEAEREKAQKDLLIRFREFLSISLFRNEGGSFTETFSLYDTARLKEAMLSREDLSSQAFLKKVAAEHRGEGFTLANLSRNSRFPLILISRKSEGGTLTLATVPQKSLIDIVSEREIYTAFTVNGQGKLVMHQDPSELLKESDFKDHPMVKDCLADTARMVKSKTKEYYDSSRKEEMLGAYSHVGDTGLCFIVQTPKRLAYLAGKELIRKMAIWILVIFSLVVVVTLFFSSTITRPLKSLAGFASKVGKGDFTGEVPKSTNDELGDLCTAFNRMNTALKERDAKIEETHKQLVQSEKMGAFGQMSAGIAHEVKNPLAGIMGYAQIAKKKIPPELGIANYLDIIEKETKRCKEIVENLMRFARAEKAAFEDINLAKVVKDSVALVDHQISISGIKIERKFDLEAQGPIVFGNANQITQVLTNIMLNAQYAMKKKGEGGVLTVEIAPVKDMKVDIMVQDTGTGIAKENLQKIFEPFFTTKPAGEGTGLGLSVTFGIIKDHKAEIRAESEVGKWTRFIITFPVKKA